MSMDDVQEQEVEVEKVEAPTASAVVDGATLKRALGYVRKFVPKSSYFGPQQTCVGVALGEGVTLFAGDWEYAQVRMTLPGAETSGDEARFGIMLDDAQVLCKQKLSGPVELVLREGKLRVGGQTMPTQNIEDMALLNEEASTPHIRIQQDAWYEALEAIYPAVSSDETLPVLTGAYLDQDDEEVVLVATDMYRLALWNMPKEAVDTLPQMCFILPGKLLKLYLAARTMLDLGSGSEVLLGLCRQGEVESASATLVTEWRPSKTGEVGSLRLTGRLIKGEFPNYPLVIPSKGARTEIPASTLIDLLGKVAPTAKGDSHRVMLIHEGGVLRAKARGQETDEGVLAEAECATGGEVNWRLAVNVNYLLDGLRPFAKRGGETTVVLETWTKPLSPIKLTSQHVPFTYVVMPMQEV